MANDTRPNDDMRSIWQNQKLEGVHMSVDELRSRAGKFNRRVSWRNAREYIAAVVVIVFFTFCFARTDDLLRRVGLGLEVAGVAYVCWHLLTKGSARQLPADLGLANSLQFHRRELERQRDLLRGVWRWYLGPMIPGLAILMISGARSNPRHLQHFGLIVGVYGVLATLLFVFVGWLNQRGAQRLDQRIRELDSLSNGD